MKKSAAFITNWIAAITGRFLLSAYKAYSSLFIKKTGYTPEYTPVRQQEIILIKRTGNVYSKVTKQHTLSLINN